MEEDKRREFDAALDEPWIGQFVNDDGRDATLSQSSHEAAGVEQLQLLMGLPQAGG